MVFWKYIKGLNQDSSISYLTYIDFRKGSDQLPHIILGDRDVAANDKGAIVCTNVPSQTIEGFLKVTSGNGFVAEGSATFSYSNNGTNYNFLQFIDGKIQVGNTTYGIVIPREVSIQGSNAYLVVGNHLGTRQGCIYSQELDTSGKCSAGYFITTSDRRAKTNIESADFDALSLILKTPIYSFDYKETQTPSIGIIAQDIQNVRIGNFDLVDNKDATGADFDYMHIHEGKLVYVLWKAVQQQQKEIEELKAQLNRK